MLILGIDPGSVTTGYGLIQHRGNNSSYVASGCIKVGKLEWPERLKQIYNDISHLIAKYSPEQVAIERIFVHKNAASALKLGQARGVAIAAAACRDLLIAEYSAREVKQALVGYGNAEKSQMQKMIKTILNLSIAPATDAADALAVALCHGNSLHRKFK
jgi:crossover junction endodeoxyribonuclease RuvC